MSQLRISQLEALRRHSLVVADSGDIDAIARWKPQDATTNPSLLLTSAEDPRWRPLMLAIAREVLTLSDGGVRLWPAMLYGALEDLSDRGWIEEIDERMGRPVNESERRRYYRITRAGRAAVAAETRRLADLVRLARSRVKPRTGESGS